MGPQMRLRGMRDCMNSEEEFNHPHLKAQVRALGTNSKQGRGEGKKEKRQVSHCDEKRKQFR